MTHSYVPGVHLAVVERRGVALLPRATGADVRAAVAEHVRAGSGLGPFIDALARGFGASLTTLPDFAIAVAEEAGVRVAVRGSFTVTGAVELAGVASSTWVEAVVAPGAVVTLAAGVPGHAESLPIEAGVVLADAVTAFGVAVEAPSAAVEAPSAAVEAPPATLDAPLGITTLAPVDDEEPAAVQASDGPELDSFALNTSFDGLWGATVVTPSGATPPPPTPAPPQRAEAPVPAPVPAPAEPAAIAPGESFVPEATPTPTAPQPQPEAVPAVPLQAPPLPATPLEGGMIAGLPDFLRTGAPVAAPAPAPVQAERAAPPAAEPSPPPAAPAPLQGDHDGATILVSELSALAPITVEPAAVAPPADVTYGTLHVSTGESVRLDRSVIVGRRPKATRVTGEVPHLIAVPSPQQDISRNHLDIRVEGSTIVVVDLDTTNGSMLRRGDADPVRLHPGEPTVVISGDAIDIGDGITVTFEDLP